MGTTTKTTTAPQRPRANKARRGRPRRAAAVLASSAAARSRRNRILQNNRTEPVVNRSRNSTLDNAFINDAHPHLWLTEDNLDISFPELLHSIQSRQMLKEISIYNILSTFTKEQIAYLYDTIAQLPQLQKFSVWASQPLALPMITSLLQKAQGLQSIAFNNVEIHSEDDLTLLASSFCHHPCLTRIALDNVRIMAPNLTLDLLLQAIAKNPRIESLRISTNFGANMIGNATDSLVPLCRATDLKELYLWGIELSDNHVQRMSQALGGDVSLCGSVPNDDSSSSPAAGSPGKLHTLSLRRYGPSVSHKGYEALVQMLQRNFCLQDIQLDDPSPLLDCDDVVMSNADGNTNSNSCTDDETTNSSTEKKRLRWEIDFYLRLNGSGVRQTLLENPNTSTRTCWVDALALHNQDLNALYYLLQESGPALFMA